MKGTSFLAITVAVLSSFAVSAPLVAKREELYSENTQRLKDTTSVQEKRQGVYSNLVLKIKDDAANGEKREELYSENAQRLKDTGA